MSAKNVIFLDSSPKGLMGGGRHITHDHYLKNWLEMNVEIKNKYK